MEFPYIFEIHSYPVVTESCLSPRVLHSTGAGAGGVAGGVVGGVAGANTAGVVVADSPNYDDRIGLQGVKSLLHYLGHVDCQGGVDKIVPKRC